MRIFVFLLVLANLLFLVWTQGYLGSPENPDAIRLGQQLLPERVNIVARDEPPAGPVEKEGGQGENPGEKPVDKPAGKKETDVCLRWNELALADADRLERLLSEKFEGVKVTRSNAAGGRSYWVFIPPLANKQEVDKKTAELKKMDAPEFFVVQDPGPNHLAISLGIFSSEAAARERLESLRAKGVRSAKMGERSVKPALVTMEILAAETQAGRLREAAAAQSPALKPVFCKGEVQ